MNNEQNKTINSLRPQYIYGCLAALLIVLAALFFQFVIKIPACPLCLFERNNAIIVAVLFLLALLHNPFNWMRRVYASALLLVSIAGMVFSGRHVWIQYFSQGEADCGPNLDLLMEHLPMTIVIERVFKETGDCAQTLTTLMGLTIPVWAFIAFALCFLFALKLLILNR